MESHHNHPSQQVSQSSARYKVWLLLLTIFVLIGLACSFTGPAGGTSPASVEETNIALQVEETLNARKPSPTPKAPKAITPTTVKPKPKPSAGSDTAEPTSEAVVPTSTEEPLPATPTKTEIPSTPTQDLQARIQGAKVLLYEDATALGLRRYAKEALANSGIKPTDVSGEMGTFRSQLTSGKNWDLIIMAGESRNFIVGEFFDAMLAAANKKTAVIIEMWYLNQIANGKIAPLLSKCGVAFQKNWTPDNYSRSIFWLSPDHPLLQEPNKGMSLIHYGPYWPGGDVGDLVINNHSGDAELIGGTHENLKTDHGLLTVCMEGRLILQTFSSHDYFEKDILPLWENYIYYTLKNHFLAVNPAD